MLKTPTKPASPATKRVETSLAALADRLITARMLRELTQAQLASYAGVGVCTVRSMEDGAGGVSIGLFMKVMDALGLLEQMDNVLDPSRDPETTRVALQVVATRRGR